MSPIEGLQGYIRKIQKYLLKKREYIVSDISDDELNKIEQLTWKGKRLNDAIDEVL